MRQADELAGRKEQGRRAGTEQAGTEDHAHSQDIHLSPLLHAPLSLLPLFPPPPGLVAPCKSLCLPVYHHASPLVAF